MSLKFKLRTFIIITGLVAISVGYPFIIHAFGTTEAEVTQWGRFIIFAGVCLLFFGILPEALMMRLRSIGLIGLCLIVLVQIPPFILWLVFDGQPMPDNIPGSEFTVSWIYSIPHVILFVISLISLKLLWTSRSL